jgi:hypothetical protein
MQAIDLHSYAGAGTQQKSPASALPFEAQMRYIAVCVYEASRHSNDVLKAWSTAKRRNGYASYPELRATNPLRVKSPVFS